MNRAELDQAKTDLLHAIRLALEEASHRDGIPMSTVNLAIEGYGADMVSDFYYDTLSEIQENEERGTHGATEHV